MAAWGTVFSSRGASPDWKKGKDRGWSCKDDAR